ncbi:MAG: alpha/beta hydrolase [Pseudolabrys sp.]
MPVAARGPRLRPARYGSLAALAALVTSGCTSPADILNSFAPVSGIEVATSIPYATGARRTLDIYRPAQAARAPVIVFFYGGSWQGGEKETYRFVASALARRGYVTIVPDYRTFPDVRYPDFLRDSARALRWARNNAARFGGDPRRLYVMGHSAGAYNAAMLALDGRWLGEVGLSPRSSVAGLIGLAGPYDFLPLRDPKLIEIFGGANRRDTQPASYVAGREPPALLMTGTFDTTVDPGNATRLADRLRAHGNDVTVRHYPAVGHVTIVGAVAGPLRFLAPVLDDVDAFIVRTTTAQRVARLMEAAE